MKTLFMTSLASLAMAAFVLSGCADPSDGEQFNEVSSSENEHPDEHAHTHPSEGPHGGDLIELGNEEYHAELVHPHDHGDDGHAHAEGGEGHEEDGEHAEGHDDDGDHAREGITIYILDGSAKEMVAIESADITLNLSHDGEPEQFKLAAMPTDTDSEGKSSRFASDNKELLEHLHNSEHIEGTLVLSIGGKSYRGKLVHEHGHDHGDEHSHGHEDVH